MLLPTLQSISTLSIDFVAATRATGSTWDEATLEVETITFNDLIVEHWKPNYIKIDVEGFDNDGGAAHVLVSTIASQ